MKYKQVPEKKYYRFRKQETDTMALVDFPFDNGTELRIITNNQGFDELKEEWSVLVKEAECTIFQTYQWNRTWWKYYEEKGHLHLLIVYHKEKLVGIAPLFRDTIHVFGRQRYLCLRFLGSGVSQPVGGDLLGLISYTDYLDFIIRPGFEDTVHTAFLNYFLACDVEYNEIVLDVVPEWSTVWNHLVPMLEKKDIQFLVDDRDSSQIINLKDSWQGYLKSLSKNRRSHIRRALKKVYNPEGRIFKKYEITEEEEVLHFFEKMVEFHQIRWNKIGSLGAFAERKNYEFHKEISLIFFREGWLDMKILQGADHKDENVAVDLNYQFKSRLYGVHSSVNVDSKHYAAGPGSVLLNLTLKEVAESTHLEYYDFLRGSEEYKRRLSNQTSRNRLIVIITPYRNHKTIVQLVKRYAVFRRYLYREWRQFLMFLEDRPFWRALAGYTHSQFSRIKQKF